MKLRMALSLLAVLGLVMAAAPAVAQIGTLYDNGPANGYVYGWNIGFGNTVSNSFNLAAPNCPTSTCFVSGFSFGVWESPGDTLSSVEWSITSAANGGTVYGSGTASGTVLTDLFLFSNGPYNIDKITVSGIDVTLSSDT